MATFEILEPLLFIVYSQFSAVSGVSSCHVCDLGRLFFTVLPAKKTRFGRVLLQRVPTFFNVYLC